jgi:hypothetical protein
LSIAGGPAEFWYSFGVTEAITLLVRLVLCLTLSLSHVLA